MTLEEHFWAGVKKGRPDECWEWTRSLTVRGGYGQFTYGGKLRKAHRVSYELHKGPIPKGLFVCHTCDNPKCCNPAHLYAGTAAQNWRDCKERGRAYVFPVRKGEDFKRSRITSRDIPMIRSSPKSLTELAKQFGVTKTAISAIRRRKSWKHIIP